MKLSEKLHELSLYYKSGNSNAVERAVIKTEDFPAEEMSAEAELMERKSKVLDYIFKEYPLILPAICKDPKLAPLEKAEYLMSKKKEQDESR